MKKQGDEQKMALAQIGPKLKTLEDRKKLKSLFPEIKDNTSL
jgi:hypothetical protein